MKKLVRPLASIVITFISLYILTFLGIAVVSVILSLLGFDREVFGNPLLYVAASLALIIYPYFGTWVAERISWKVKWEDMKFFSTMSFQNLRLQMYLIAAFTYILANVEKFSHSSWSFVWWESFKGIPAESYLTFIVLDTMIDIYKKRKENI